MAGQKRKLPPGVFVEGAEGSSLRLNVLGAGREVSVHRAVGVSARGLRAHVRARIAQVGRSCILMEFKGKTIMFDCGIHTGARRPGGGGGTVAASVPHAPRTRAGFSGMGAMPYFDVVDPATIDVLFISHFHLDHAASVPYLTEHTTFKVPPLTHSQEHIRAHTHASWVRRVRYLRLHPRRL